MVNGATLDMAAPAKKCDEVYRHILLLNKINWTIHCKRKTSIQLYSLELMY